MNEKLKVDEMGRLGLTDFRAARKFPLSVVLDNVRSVHNVGSVFRTADAFRLREVLLCGITAVPPSAEMHKTALGAEDSVAWRHFASTADALAELRARGVKVCVLEQCRRSVALQDFVFEPGSEYALVLGRCGAGDSAIRHQTLAQCQCGGGHGAVGDGEERAFCVSAGMPLRWGSRCTPVRGLHPPRGTAKIDNDGRTSRVGHPAVGRFRGRRGRCL